MEKQLIEIEVPDGKKAVFEDGTIKFVSRNVFWENITSIYDALAYVKNNLPECKNLIDSYKRVIPKSYEYYIICYRIVVAAITNNEKRNLSSGEKWYPVVQFCLPEYEKYCWGKTVVGTIESNGKFYSVVSGSCSILNTTKGLGDFYEIGGVSFSEASISFLSVSSKEVADHIATYFGRLLFNINFGGTNCNWRWINL